MTDEERPTIQIRDWLQAMVVRVNSLDGNDWAASVESRNAAHDALQAVHCWVWDVSDEGIDLMGLLIDEIERLREENEGLRRTANRALDMI